MTDIDQEVIPYTEEEILELRKKVQSITMGEYCRVPRPVDFQELVKEAVQIEDIINHPPVRTPIPKMEYPKSYVWKCTAKYAFFRQFMP